MFSASGDGQGSKGKFLSSFFVFYFGSLLVVGSPFPGDSPLRATCAAMARPSGSFGWRRGIVVAEVDERRPHGP
ncbi:hypothetical protein F3Y22_tig00111584pilonHSYRG00258 [Hibiscus syriacus]|uniref:Uncharacterized protein n=1 Tax=Hibiscus syriacus TaxID=106335 RepID=A0A6A2XM69_HIBSY|nr:hypothetical protein F3Y22_tig00111584pilonHSYRG00258 [Hibiscus syriacus]